VTRYSECFFLMFGQLAVGGAFGLAVPEFRRLERGFYKSSAGLFLGFGLIFLIARVSLTVHRGVPGAATSIELLTWAGFLGAFTIYLVSLWGDAGRPRARAFASTVILGLAALGVSAFTYRPPELASIPWPLYALPFVTGAMMLGGVTTGMLLGHWYLIDLGLSIDPLDRVYRFFAGATALHLVALLLVPAIAWASGPPGAAAVGRLLDLHLSLYLTRLLLGPVPTLLIAWLIRRTLAIPQTMAATGLFYVAVLFATVGEMVGRLVLFRTGLPL
jgi:hypothetical protein